MLTETEQKMPPTLTQAEAGVRGGRYRCVLHTNAGRRVGKGGSA